jgi:hypothetical protein
MKYLIHEAAESAVRIMLLAVGGHFTFKGTTQGLKGEVKVGWIDLSLPG